MSQPPHLSAEVMQILARRARTRRILIGLTCALGVSVLGVTAWMLWQGKGESGSDVAPAVARGDQGGTAAMDSGGKPAETMDSAPINPAGSGQTDTSLFDIRPGADAGPGATDETATEASVLRTGDVLEQLATERAMMKSGEQPMNIELETFEAIERLNQMLADPSPDKITAHVRHGELMRPLVEEYLVAPEARRLPMRVGMQKAALMRVEHLTVLLIQLDAPYFQEAAFIRDEASGKWLLDWEAFVGFSSLPWEDLRKKRPQTPVNVRVHMLLGDYYNFDFSDENKYLVVRMDSPDNYHIIFGYVERDHPLADEILEGFGNQQVRPALVRIRYPDSAVHDNQVIIEDVIAWRWLDVRDEPGRLFSAQQDDGEPSRDPDDEAQEATEIQGADDVLSGDS